MHDAPTPCPGGCGDAGDPVWCAHCQRAARASLAEVDRLASLLEQQADGYPVKAPGSSAPGATQVDPPSPSPVTDLLDQLLGDVQYAEGEWRRLRGFAAVKAAKLNRTAYERALSLAFLSTNSVSILRHPEMTDHVRRLMNWRLVLQRAAKAEPERQDKAGRCPRCRFVNVLRLELPSRIVVCRSCSLSMTEGEYERDVVASADSAVIAESRDAQRLLDQRPPP